MGQKPTFALQKVPNEDDAVTLVNAIDKIGASKNDAERGDCDDKMLASFNQ